MGVYVFLSQVHSGKKTIPLEPVNSSSSVASRQSTGLVCPSAIATHCRGAVLPPFSPPVGVITPLHKDKQHFKTLLWSAEVCEVRRAGGKEDVATKLVCVQIQRVPSVPRGWTKKAEHLFFASVCKRTTDWGTKKNRNRKKVKSINLITGYCQVCGATEQCLYVEYEN